MTKLIAFFCLALAALCATAARADAVTDWNIRSGEVIVEAKIGTPPAVRVMAIVQTAAHQAVQTATNRGASVESALAAAHRVTLAKLLPAQQAMVEAVYRAALGKIADSATKFDGIADGESAANAVLAARADDGAAMPETYRPLHHRRRLCAHRHTCCHAMAAAQTLADDERRAIPPRHAAGVDQ